MNSYSSFFNIKTSKLLILSFFIVLQLFLDFELSFYGRGFNLFQTKMVYDFNADYDSYSGFRIEQEGFIQVLGSDEVINNKVTVSEVEAYAYDSSGIYSICKDSNMKKFAVKIILDQNRRKGSQLQYFLIDATDIPDDLQWYQVVTSKYLTFLEFTKVLSLFVVLLSIIIWLFLKKVRSTVS